MKHVLILEDNPMWARILSHYAAQAGATSHVTISPAQAMMAVDETLPDCIIMDFLLASETGLALLHELISYDDLASIPVIICTGVPIQSEHVAHFQNVRAVLDKSSMTPAQAIDMLSEVLNENAAA